MVKEPPGLDSKGKEKLPRRQGEFAQQEPIESSWLQLAGFHPDLPSGYHLSKSESLQQVIGNRAVQKLITHKQNSSGRNLIQLVEGGRWDIGLPDRRTKEQILADEAAGAARVKGDIDIFEGHTLTTDPVQAEKVLKSVIAEKGFRGAIRFLWDYGFGNRRTIVETHLRDRILSVLKAKLAALEKQGKDYAENTFYRRAVNHLNQILVDSERQLLREAKNYGVHLNESGDIEITENQSVAKLAEAARVILDKHARLEELIKKRKQYEQKVPITEDIESGMRLSRRTIGYQTHVTDPVAHQKATEEINNFQKEYLILRQGYEVEFPMLASFRPPEGLSKLKDIARGGKKERNTSITGELLDKYKNIQKIRKVANDGKFVWKQEMIVEGTKRALGVQPGSIPDKGIDAKVAEVESSEVAKQLGLALVSLLGALILAIPSGGSSLVAWGTTIVGGGMLVAAGGLSIYEGIQEYSTQKAATGTAFDKAQAISQNDPSLFWLALNIVMTITDIGLAAKAFTKAARAIRTVEKTVDVEKAARETYRNAGLGNIMPEEEFVQNILLTMKGSPEVVGAASKNRTALLTSLLEGKHPELADLINGKEKAIANLLNTHGEWKSLLRDLEQGNESMRTIANNLSNYRQREVVNKLKEIVNAKPMKGGGQELTSDIDFYLASDEMGGAGEKLMKAETYMTQKYGKGWEDSLNMHFYTDIETRLNLPETAFKNMKEADEALFALKQHEASNKLRMARDLQSAGSDRIAVARIEKEIKDLGLDAHITEIRKMAATGEDAAKIQRNALLLKIDEMEGAYKVAKQGNPELAKELAKKIQSMQMEANFYTEEAIISPLVSSKTLKGSAAQQLQIADSIMEWKSMLQHNISKYGSVAKAKETYEPWKYFGRQIDQALKKEGLDPMLKSRLEMMREKAAFTYKNRWYPKETTGKLGRTAAKDEEVYNNFIIDMTSIANEIRKKAIRELGKVASGVH
jgi:hypothetical protein